MNYKLPEIIMDTIPERTERVALPCSQGILWMERKRILWLQSEGNYSWAHFADGCKTLLPCLLKQLEAGLSPAGFYRIHHQYVVNLNQLVRFEKADGGQVVLTDGTVLPVSRARKQGFLQKIYTVQ